jgi:hypothetical protein
MYKNLAAPGISAGGAASFSSFLPLTLRVRSAA